MEPRLSLLLESATPAEASLLFERFLTEAELAEAGTLGSQVAEALPGLLSGMQVEATAADGVTLRLNVVENGQGVSGRLTITDTDGSFSFDGLRTNGQRVDINGYGTSPEPQAVATAVAEELRKALGNTPAQLPLEDTCRQLLANLKRAGGLSRARVGEREGKPVLEVFYEPDPQQDVFLVADITVGYLPADYRAPEKEQPANPAVITARLHHHGQDERRVVALNLGSASKSASIALHVFTALRKLVVELNASAA